LRKHVTAGKMQTLRTKAVVQKKRGRLAKKEKETELDRKRVAVAWSFFISLRSAPRKFTDRR
jgi:hypothetical protein